MWPTDIWISDCCGLLLKNMTVSGIYVQNNLHFHPVMLVFVLLLLGDRNNEDCDITLDLKES